MIVVIDLGGTNTKFGLINSGKIIAASSCPAEPKNGIEKHLNKVMSLIEKLCIDNNTEIDQCKGIGLLSTGLVDSENMRVLTTNEKYDDAIGFDFKKWAMETTGLELRMENDAKGALLGEYHYGAGQGSENVMMITFGTGIGTGVISESKLLNGSNYSGGNLGGHMIVRSGGRKCTCGARGCLEAEASGWSLPILAKEHLLYSSSTLQGEATIGFKEMLDHAEQGDECAIDLRRHCFQIWGEAIVSYIHLFDPAKIILGGGLMNSADLVLPRFERIIKEMSWSHGKGLELIKAQHPNNAGILGAAALFKEEEESYYPLTFEEVYKATIWGGELLKKLPRELPKTAMPIGESWEIVDRPDDQSCVQEGPLAGKTLRELIQEDPEGIVGYGHQADQPFPLLMKIIDAGQDLSLQVHPDEETCRHIDDAEPKTEMWYVLDHSSEAEILTGIKEGVSPEKFRDSVNDPEVRKLMHSYSSEQGQSFFIKATTMHAIGGGNLIYEVQQNSDTTYRVSDWGRIDKNGNPRELHVDQAMTCLHHSLGETKPSSHKIQPLAFTPLTHSSELKRRQLAICEHFQVEEIEFEGAVTLPTDIGTFQTVYAVDSDLRIECNGKSYDVKHGQTCLIPAKCGECTVYSQTKGRVVSAKIPA
jgi:glucokinase